MKLRLFICSIALLLMPIFVHAAAVSPSILDVVGSKGETTSVSFTVINASATDQTYYLGTMSFVSKNESGSPEFLSQNEKDGLITWIQLPIDHIVVPARSKIDVPFKIMIPSDIASGGYHAAVTVSSAPSDIVQTNGALIEAKTAVLVFLTVKGETNEKIELLDFSGTHTLVTSFSQESFQYRIQNQGNTFVIPTGSIVVKDVFGRTILNRNANPDASRILPMSTRKFQIASEGKGDWISVVKDQTRFLAMGPLRVQLSLKTDSGTSNVQKDFTIWYFPIHLIALVVFLLLFVIGGYKFLEQKQKHK